MKTYAKLITKIFFAFLILLSLASLITFLGYKAGPKIGDYTVSIVVNLVALLYLGFILQQTFRIKKGDDSLYEWLDCLEGGHSLLRDILRDKKDEKDILMNLRNTYNKILIYSKHNKNNLMLLKAYYKALSKENGFDLLAKTFIAFIFGLFATNLNNGNLIEFINIFSKREISINTTFQYFLDILTLLIVFILFMSYLIRDFYSTKKRLIIIQEILDVAIQEK